jgi:FdhE protein
MPYVALPQSGRKSRMAGASTRWSRLLAERPDLQPAVDLQRRLLTGVIILSDAIEKGRVPRLSLPAKYLAAKLHKGVPALTGEPVPLPTALITPTLLSLCLDLAQGGAGGAAEHIHSALVSGAMDAGSLLSASLTRDQVAIRTAAVHRGLAPDLLWLVAELAISPFAHTLQRTMVAPGGRPAPEDALRSALDAWSHGYCPFCGSWPALVEATAGVRVLRCSFCAFAWSLDEASCLYCAAGPSQVETLQPDLSRPDRRLETCRRCRAYVKTVDVDALTPFPLVAIGDLETMELDVLAMQQRYQRPPLRSAAPAHP